MKTGLAVILTAVLLSTACSGNRTAPPAEPLTESANPPTTSAPPPDSPGAGAAGTETPAPVGTEIPAEPTSPVATTTTEPGSTPAAVATNATSAPAISEPAPTGETERAAPPPPPPVQKPIDPLELMRENEAKRADYQQKVAEAEAKLVETNAAIGQWQNTLLAFKNPFRPRPSLTAEEAQAIEGKDGATRVGWAEGKLAEATAARDAAQKALNDLKANPPY